MGERGETPADPSARSAVRRLYGTEFARLSQYAKSIVGDPAEAEDLVQEAFVTLLDRPPDDEDRIMAWLRVVVRRRCLDVLRRRKNGFDKEAEAHRASSGVAQPSAEAEMFRADEIERIRRALAQLPERDRKALLMRHSGYSYREIGKALDVETAAVGVLLLRAMKKWRRNLDAQEEKESAHPAPQSDGIAGRREAKSAEQAQWLRI